MQRQLRENSPFLVNGEQRTSPGMAATKAARGASKEELRRIRGRAAEQQVRKLLDELPGEKVVWHNVKCSGGDIDHVVLSRTKGLLLIETKAHWGNAAVSQGKIVVRGQPPEKNFAVQVARNADWLRREIKKLTGREPWVNCILVFTNAFVAPHSSISKMKIVNDDYLLLTIGQTRSNPAEAQALWADQKLIRFAFRKRARGASARPQRGTKAS